MGLPQIDILFKSLATSAIARGNRGVVALIIKDVVPTINPIVLTDSATVVATLTTENQEQIAFAWMGGVNVPIKVIVYVEAVAAVDYSLSQKYLETIKWDYLAVPCILATEVTAMATWIKSMRDTMDLKVKAVLPNVLADHEGIINFATDGIIVGADTYTAIDYCSRIAGILAGNPLTMSATYQVLPEITDVPHFTNAAFDALINAGKLVLINDGEKVKIARAVNSLVTITPGKSTDYQKIKIIDIMDLEFNDIKSTYSDNYVGKVPNKYDNKCILITAINSYFLSLEAQNLLDKGFNSVGIDIAAQTLYLEGIGTDTSTMTVQDIKNANTGSIVMLAGTTRPLDAMEDLELNLTL